jgi:multisubunit Na+/H+ antiporter MnhE subunit
MAQVYPPLLQFKYLPYVLLTLSIFNLTLGVIFGMINASAYILDGQFNFYVQKHDS